MGPCENCLDRWIDVNGGTRCHSHCARYLQFAQQCEVVRRNRAIEVEKPPQFGPDYGLRRSLSHCKKRSKPRIAEIG